MKIRYLLLTLVGLATSFALPTFSQEQNAVDPEVRQQIEAARVKFGEAFSKHDAAAVAALFTPDAVDVWEGWTGGSAVASGQQAIEKRYAIELSSGASLVGPPPVFQLYAIGNEICAINEFTTSTFGHKGCTVTIYVRDVRDPDTCKISMAYSN